MSTEHMTRFVTSNKETEALILDGISQILDNGRNMPRNYNEKPLTPKEKFFLIEVLHKELEDPEIPAGLIFLYGQILDYIKESIIYN